MQLAAWSTLQRDNSKQILTISCGVSTKYKVQGRKYKHMEMGIVSDRVRF